MADRDDISDLRFGNYEVLSRPDGKPDELGRGGFGRTYRARHAFLGTEVALKVILDKLAFDEAARKRFLKEAQEHAKLSHRGIARITDFGEAEGTFFYAMELCRDGDLKEYVKKRGPLPPAEALALIRQTAEALQFAHSRGIVHRDIKPSNLLLVMSEDGPPQVKLIDFGLVRRMAREADETADHETASQWSPVFASPEQIRELPLDERTDIFSLGMTAWFLMAGSGPVDGSTQDIIQERLSDARYEPRLPSSLTGPARAVVAKMLEKSTATRFRNGTELLDALREAMKSAPAPQRLTMAERFILEPAGRTYLGEVFRGTDRERNLYVRVTKVYREHDGAVISQVAEKARKLAAARPAGLVPVLEFTEYPEGPVVVEEDCTGIGLADILRREGTVSLEKIAGVLWDAATGIDALCECGASPGPLEQAVLTGVPPAGTVDWSRVQIHITAQLAEPESDWTSDADVTSALPAASPLQAFASLLYLAVGGRHVRAQAFYSSAECIPIPGLNGNANRTLASSLSGESSTPGCVDLLRAILKDEGLPVDSIARRAKERAHHSTTRTPDRTGSSAALTASQITETLRNIETTAHAAKEAAEQALRVRLRPGLDDSGLSQHQLDARRHAKEAAAFKQQAEELAAAGQLDAATARRLADSTTTANAAVSRALAAARALTADQESETRSARTQTGPLISVPPPQPLPAEAREEAVIHLQPAVPAPPPRKSHAAAVVIGMLLLGGAGAGAWWWYDKNNRPPPAKPDVVETKTDNGGTTTTTNHKDPDPPPPPPPPPPKERQVVISFTGDLPKKDGEITFKGIASPPKPAQGKDRLEYTFTLAPDAAIPDAIINPDAFGSVRTVTGTDHVEYRLTKNRPPATIRLKGITAKNARAVTIGGQPGRLEGDALVFERSAQTDGTFKLDVSTWQMTDKPELLSPGVWEATMTAPLFQVSLDVPATVDNPWKTVTFTPVNLDALPPLMQLEDLGPNCSKGPENLRYSIEGPAPEPAMLPAGDYTLTWTALDPNDPPRTADKLTVHPDKKNELPVPAAK